jgi:hypothetical protein
MRKKAKKAKKGSKRVMKKPDHEMTREERMHRAEKGKAALDGMPI